MELGVRVDRHGSILSTQRRVERIDPRRLLLETPTLALTLSLTLNVALILTLTIRRHGARAFGNYRNPTFWQLSVVCGSFRQLPSLIHLSDHGCTVVLSVWRAQTSIKAADPARYQEYSFSRLFVPWNIRSHDGTFVLGTIRSLELLFSRLFVPWHIRSLDRSLPETVFPWTVRSWTIRSQYRILHGKFIPLNTTVAIHRST